MKDTPHTQTRRDQIIEAAFHLLGQKKDWSLSEAAERVGVSKTALYRHFSNRAGIEAAMEIHFRKALVRIVEGAGPDADSIRREAVALFRSENGYIAYLVNKVFNSPGYEYELFSFMQRHSPRTASLVHRMKSASPENREKIANLLFKSCVSVILAGINLDSMQGIQNELLDRIRDGFPFLAEPSTKRLAEIEQETVIDEGYIQEGGKIYTAIVSCIQKWGIHGTTIERIAEESGTAKSSLYFYHPTKESMLQELAETERENILALFERHVGSGRSFAEQLYIVMNVQKNYLLAKPDLIPVFNWIRYHQEERPQPVQDHGNVLDRIMRLFNWHELPGTGTDDDRFKAAAIIKWASILATSVVVNHRRAEINRDEIGTQLRGLFYSMLRGDKEIE